MSWNEINDKATESSAVTATPPADAPKTEDKTKEQSVGDPITKPETVVDPTTNDSASVPPKTDDKPPEKDMVAQDLIGKVAKKVREKAKEKLATMQKTVDEVLEENRQLKAKLPPENEPDPDEVALQQKIAQGVQVQFFQRQDAYGREKYGADKYQDAVDLIKAKADPVLNDKIWSAANPADTLMAEAQRLAEEQELGSPAEREKKLREQIRAEERKKLDDEIAERLAAKNNQPANLRDFRSAPESTPNGAEKPALSWTNSLPG